MGVPESLFEEVLCQEVLAACINQCSNMAFVANLPESGRLLHSGHVHENTWPFSIWQGLLDDDLQGSSII